MVDLSEFPGTEGKEHISREKIIGKFDVEIEKRIKKNILDELKVDPSLSNLRKFQSEVKPVSVRSQAQDAVRPFSGAGPVNARET